MSIEVKRQIIYEKMNNLELTDNLQTIIIQNNIPHTNNKNGTFLNISLLEEKYLLLLEEYVGNKKYEKKEIHEEDIKIIPKNYKKENKKQKTIEKKQNMKNKKLSGLESKIVSFSI